MAATPHQVRDQTATAAHDRPRPSAPTATSRYESALGDLSEPGAPLNWSDIVPGWPDDVDLDPLPDPPEEEEPPPRIELGDTPRHKPAAAPGSELRGGYPPGTPWASPPGAVPIDRPPVRKVLGNGPPPAGVLPVDRSTAPPPVTPLDSATDPLPSHPGDQMDDAEQFRPYRAPAVRPAGPERRPLPPPAWVLPDPPAGHEPAWPVSPGPSGAEPVWPVSPGSSGADRYPDDDEPRLSTAGAFGGDRADGRRFGLGAFDPGRRGVKALAVVAVVVIAIAAFLAWRARPQVDTVAPPSFEMTTAPADPAVNGGGPGAGAPASVVPTAEVVVAVGGKVRKPGLVRLPPGARVADALTAAGGADPGVDVAMLNLARKVVDGELILVGVTPSPGVVLPTGPAVTGGAAPAGGLVNLNTATLADLDTLPGVGPVLAQRILDARDAQGGFKAVSDLRKVDGIGDARYEQLKDLVTV
jgi:competence protein ComEA